MRPTAALPTSSSIDVVSPELALVDARLAVHSRSALSDPEDSLARCTGDSSSRPQPSVLVSSSSSRLTKDDVSGALRRLTEAAAVAEIEPVPARSRRLINLIGALAAVDALAMALFALDLKLSLS
jgi:hypothetical protein